MSLKKYSTIRYNYIKKKTSAAAPFVPLFSPLRQLRFALRLLKIFKRNSVADPDPVFLGHPDPKENGSGFDVCTQHRPM